MLLTSRAVDEIRQLLADGRASVLAGLSIQQISLPGLLELAACIHQAAASNPPETTRFFGHLRHRFTPLERCVTLLGADRFARQTYQEELFAAPAFEVAPVHGGRLQTSDWQLFLQRFGRSLQRHGYGDRFAYALAGAFGEMADNVVQHGAPSGQPNARGLAGFQVSEEQASFVVVDTGRGLLASLRENPRWQHLQEHAQALEAVIRLRATRRVHNAYGDGFNELFNALVDRQGSVRLRSGEASVQLGAERESRRFELEFGAVAAGVSVGVICARRGEPKEISVVSAKSS